MNIPGEDSDGVMNALELIAGYKTGHIREIAGTVVVVGAGNTAIDAANAARRLGAETVYLLYRRGESDMAAFDFEYEHAKQEGVQFLWRRQPVAIRSGRARRLLLDTVQVREVDQHACCPFRNRNSPSTATRRARHRPVAAYKLMQRVPPALKCANGRIVVDRATGRTGNPRYFAGGDCVNGGREVVDAVADGKRAALAMLKIAEAAYA